MKRKTGSGKYSFFMFIPAAFAAARAIAFAAAVSSCAMPGGWDWVEERVNTDNRVIDYNLQAYVPVPVAGEAAVTAVTDRAEMEVRVRWTDEAGAAIEGEAPAGPFTFALGAVYRAEITLTAREGYAFDPAVSFAYPAGTVETQPEANTGAAERALTPVVYKPAPPLAPVTDLNLTAAVPAPALGGTPVTVVNEAQYTGTVTWSPTPSAQGFAALAYTATLTLSPRADYTFEEIPEKPNPAAVPGAFYHGGQGVTVTHDAGEADKTLTVTITFPQAKRSEGLTIPFSGENSVIDMIRGAAGAPFLELTLAGIPEETVTLGDLSGGLVLSPARYGEQAVLDGNGIPMLVDGSGTPLAKVPYKYKNENGGDSNDGLGNDGGELTVVLLKSVDEGGRPVVLHENGNPVQLGDGAPEAKVRSKNPPPNTNPWWAVEVVTNGIGGNYLVKLHRGKADPWVATWTDDIWVDVELDEKGTLCIDDKVRDKDGTVIQGVSPPILVEKYKLAAAKNNPIEVKETKETIPADSPTELVIDGGGRVIDLTGTTKGSLITVGAGITLTLRNITLKGLAAGEGDGNTSAIVCVGDGGRFIMEDGAVLRDNYTAGYGGGVYVDGAGASGAFTMKGGLITGNTADNGGGVCVNMSGIFYMEGGEIKGNTADNYGGGVSLPTPGNGSRIVKSGGTIAGNTVGESVNQVYIGYIGKSRNADLGPGDYLWYDNGSEHGFE